jgi:glutathione synthase/RimK-type ligase-like ATP-grasp enzyme
MGYNFPHNTASAAKIAADKVATYILLDEADVPAVPHFLVRLTTEVSTDWPMLYGPVLIKAGISRGPVVVKPLDRSGGYGVILCPDLSTACRAIDRLLDAYRVAVVAPFIAINSEVRLIMLDGSPLLAYEKLRAKDWRHNLELGAQARILTTRAVSSLSDLARSACDAIGIRLAAVDLVADHAGNWQVLEINSGIRLDAFLAQEPSRLPAVVRIYSRILAAMRLGDNVTA